jgi:prophage regulatory protein
MPHNQLQLPVDGLLRQRQILGDRGDPKANPPVPPTPPIIPVSPSTWWAGIKAGRFPKPVKLGPRVTAWRVADIRALLDGTHNPTP